VVQEHGEEQYAEEEDGYLAREFRRITAEAEARRRAAGRRAAVAGGLRLIRPDEPEAGTAAPPAAPPRHERGGRSGARGSGVTRVGRRWRARLLVPGEGYRHLGMYATEREAEQAVAEARKAA
jgi:hypothetical protein